LLTELTALLELPAGAVPPTLSGVDPAEPWVARAPETGAYEGSVEDGFDGLAGIDRTRAFVKVQDGCSFHCTYCVIPMARGSARSIPPDAVLADVRKTLAEGHREVVLTGINVGTYAGATAGDSPLTLAGLVRRVLAETTVERLRLSSIEPQHITADLLDVWLEFGGRCQPHFHIPLQAGDDTILRRMGRRYDTAFYDALVARIRGAIPDVAIHADVIVGFPGEDEAAWARTLGFLHKLDLAGVHVFRYSSRPGTPAARMVGQVDARTRKRRAAEALALAAEARAAFAALQLGRELRVLFERPLSDGRWVGHAGNHVAVAAASTDGRPLDNVIGSVVAESIEPAAGHRIAGRLVAVDRAAIPLRARGQACEPLAKRARK
jgi:threonylcarbamoyladenosine tRNA methylthiotransferase MtaB